MAPTPRRRAANGRFAADAPADLGAIRADYEAGVLSPRHEDGVAWFQTKVARVHATAAA